MATKQKIVLYICTAIISFCMGYWFGDVTGFVKGVNQTESYYYNLIQETQEVQ